MGVNKVENHCSRELITSGTLLFLRESSNLPFRQKVAWQPAYQRPREAWSAVGLVGAAEAAHTRPQRET